MFVKKCPSSTVFVLVIFFLYVLVTMFTFGEKRDQKVVNQTLKLNNGKKETLLTSRKRNNADSFLCRKEHNTNFRTTMFHEDDANQFFDAFFKKVKWAKAIGPTSKRGKFKLWIDKTAPNLGLHWDGKKINQSCGYYRLNFPVVPRTGSTWFRQIWEEATGITSGNMWRENTEFDPSLQAYINKTRCGTDFSKAGGVKKPPDCSKANMRPPGRNETLLFRSHMPFFPTYPSDLGANCIDFNILMLRNPFDVFHSLVRCYKGDHAKQSICFSPMEFLGKWVFHYDFWMSQKQPLYVFRYEDLRLNLKETVLGIFNALPKVLTKGLTLEKLQGVIERQTGDVNEFKKKCGGNMRHNWNRNEMFQVMAYYAPHMAKYGYRIEFHPDNLTRNFN